MLGRAGQALAQRSRRCGSRPKAAMLLSLKLNVAYLLLKVCALSKKRTTLPVARETQRMGTFNERLSRARRMT